MRWLQFEFVSYDAEGANEERKHRRFQSEASARSFAGRWSRRRGGPVDIARAGAADWAERYLTTASPSDVHAHGYRFERLD